MAENKRPSNPINYSIRFRLMRDESFFGPGTAQLLRLVDETKSLSAAAAKMNMAYSKAWKIIKIAETQLDFKLLERKIGGENGGGSELTIMCRKFLEKYFLMEKEIYSITDKLFLKYFEEYLK